MPDRDIERLLRAARSAADGSAPEMPFGFDTRVLARARGEERHTVAWQLAPILRRVAFAATVVTACAGAAAYWQMSENDDLGEPLTNAYAIADNAIDLEVFQ
ncbi:MAG: hypothetical protein M3Y80_01665 [Verrucomicrobiota bacterium]|nr:hypothetical protein [Verrucomicrobiota bacterium]